MQTEATLSSWQSWYLRLKEDPVRYEAYLAKQRLRDKTPERRAQASRKMVSRYRRNKLKAMASLGGVCSVCNVEHPPADMHFHHVDPATKVTEVSELLIRAWAVIEQELSKCVLMCAECHMKEHHSH
jgi:DNA repair exonuclease SbcCD ATPase subunit